MTLSEIKGAADQAESFPGSKSLNWNEVPMWAFLGWCVLFPRQTCAATTTFDVESVKGMFEKWWRTAATVALVNAPPPPPPNRDINTLDTNPRP